jgi:CRP/FNR family cyclic AMP-dependent transcriptional regulator
MTVANLLKEIPLFTGLNETDLSELETHLVYRHYPKNQIIFHKGDEGSNLYIIKKGSARVILPSPQGEEVILAILTAGEIIGELSFIDGKNRSATVEVLEDTEMLLLSRHDFFNFLSKRFDAVLRILAILTQRLRETDNLIEEAYFLDITSRVARKIISLGKQFGINEHGVIKINIRITQSNLAAMVGASRESVNKQIRVFKQKGLVSMDKGYLEILDHVRLARRARTDRTFIT